MIQFQTLLSFFGWALAWGWTLVFIFKFLSQITYSNSNFRIPFFNRQSEARREGLCTDRMENGNNNALSIISREKLDQVAAWVAATMSSAFFSSLERFSCVNIATNDLDDDEDDDDQLLLSDQPRSDQFGRPDQQDGFVDLPVWSIIQNYRSFPFLNLRNCGFLFLFRYCWCYVEFVPCMCSWYAMVMW